jgi:RNA polymerase sigma-70 factor (ECF subfamily)
MDLEAAVSALAPGLLRYCLGRTADRGLAEDLAQEALTALVQRWRRAGAPECPAAFVFGIARRRARRALWRRRFLEPLGRATVDEPASAAADPETTALWADELALLGRALGRLPRCDREVLLLVAAGELGTEETARTLGLSRSAIKMRLHRARKRLQTLLEAADGDPTTDGRSAAERC